MTLAELRGHLIECFEPGVCIVGNTTQDAIVRAIDRAEQQLAAMREARDEACEIACTAMTLRSDFVGPWSKELNRCLLGSERIAELRKVGG